MNLTKIEIKCYKSIVNQVLDTPHKCMSFVGLNEAGKTNLLNAIRMFDWNIQPTKKDKSKLNNCFPSVTFHFSIENISHIIKKLEEQVQDSSWNALFLPSSIKIEGLKVIRKTDQDNNTFDDIEVDFSFTCKPTESYVIIEDDTFLEDIEEDIEEDTPLKDLENLQGVEDEYIDLEVGLIRDIKEVPQSQMRYFKAVTKEHVRNFLQSSLKEILKQNLPTVVYWEYSKKYLIPSEITYTQFLKDNKPSEKSKPLFNIFLIAKELGIYNTQGLIERVEKWRNDSSQRRKDTKIINEAINKYIRKIWRDYDQNIIIDLEASQITIHVSDPKSPSQNFYEMAERSQGFKTFISFLLTIAAESHLDLIDNYFLILDEPETHLHPSGVRFMRNELLKLANQGNNIFFATHSIFMIDRTTLDRHVIMEKINEHTLLKKVERNNITQESVIYEALGTRVDEFSIAANNIMFEGHTDRLLFDFYLNKCIRKNDNPFSKFELFDGGGTTPILKFFKDKIIPQDSKWRLILDNDKPALNLVTELKKMFNSDYEKFFLIEHYSDQKDYELEDLLPSDMVESVFNEALENVVPKVKNSFKIDKKKVFSHQVQEFKNGQSLEKDEKKELEIEFKKLLGIRFTEILYKIEKQTTIEARKTAFHKQFGSYADFVEGYINTAQEAK